VPAVPDLFQSGTHAGTGTKVAEGYFLAPQKGNTLNNFDEAHYQAFCESILDKAKQQGATSAEVTVSLESGFSVTSRLEEVETVEHHNDKGLAITVFFDQRSGSVQSSDLSSEAIDLSIEKACNIAKYTSPDPYSGLAESKQLAFDYPKVDLDFPWDINTEQALELAIKCEHLARKDQRITNSEGAQVSSHRSLHVYANSHGFVGSYPGTHHSLHCVLIAQSDGQMHRDYEYTMARDATQLMPIEELAQRAAAKTVRRLGAKRLKTRSAPVMFNPEMAKSLIGNLVSAMSGGSIYRKSSFLVDHLGKQILPEHLNLIQKPHLAKGIASAPFDNEGVLTKSLEFISKGVLTNYFLSSYSARKLGLESTGNAGGIYNLILSSNGKTFDELLAEMNTGLLVTELIGHGVNIVTGDYSRGAFGYWVENGEIQFPVNEVTIAGNLSDIFKNIIGVANDVDRRSKIQTGSLLVGEMMIAGE
jgi:PmbA protein